jgi:ribosomal protein S18 acetylase RimI-like enzyme
MGGGITIRPYRHEDERGWVVCRLLSLLDTAFFDDVRQSKEHYEHDSIELVAELEGEVVGLIDVECETEPGTVCESRPGLGGMIWHLGVHPDHQRRGIASTLLREAEVRARDRGIARFEAWTRDDQAARAWYESSGFELVHGYLHVYVELDEGLRDLFPVTADGIRPVTVFAHYLGEDSGAMRARFRRVHEDVLYELRFDA